MKKKFCCAFCNGRSFSVRFKYDSPPINETKFEFKNQIYKRHYISCNLCGHWFLEQKNSLQNLYLGEYINSTYGNKLAQTFEKIISLPKEKSDNFGRIRRIKKFKGIKFSNKKSIELLDVGSGLGIFPYSVKKLGWDCTAIDSDKYSTRHFHRIV